MTWCHCCVKPSIWLCYSAWKVFNIQSSTNTGMCWLLSRHSGVHRRFLIQPAPGSFQRLHIFIGVTAQFLSGLKIIWIFKYKTIEKCSIYLYSISESILSRTSFRFFCLYFSTSIFPSTLTDLLVPHMLTQWYCHQLISPWLCIQGVALCNFS